ncbi:MBL fold metallo-hydrolase [Dactylosporangium sucinum]|uniref:Zn-dependent hydrolase n=1 Tax=Dactylosporangium sucinum TaxID=1424081 RepID=A0A917T5T7_9ACTN|nr:MBL fold metallo-hydrolase [Dactylosporangium sucinum]GGM11598.1 Zn-dependent hydrolase [Dactylosporangium sucinum]
MGKTTRVLALAAVAAAAGGVAWALRDLPAQLGAAPSGARAERMRRSPQYGEGKFRNSVPADVVPSNAMRKAFVELLTGNQPRRPAGTIPVVRPELGGRLPDDGLHVTWLGHSTALVEIEGVRVLFDPVWSDRCSPTSFFGPKRMHPVPLKIDELPRIDAIVISHDHYDHLDLASIRALLRSQQAPFLVPLGVGAHLERWGVPAERLVELDWDEDVTIKGVRLTATAARHFSGRKFTRDGTLWASWVVKGARRSVFYTGDSGYFAGYKEIGEQHGPFDLSLIQVGAYNEAWPDIHMKPEDGASAHLDVQARVLIPLHWCTFSLAMHAWSEPVERLLDEARARDITLVVPRPGDRVDIDALPAVEHWWRAIA